LLNEGAGTWSLAGISRLHSDIGAFQLAAAPRLNIDNATTIGMTRMDAAERS
jgi:hypothetical protein